ncbi:MAG: hypothetical protein KKA79_08700 [Nanoarchaeota archaeon]|nr:hypothetical protein [Nanoarchaeota archaeon]MCG2718318.1 hypothetical protein [Nanoarchaeota archaeon]
MKHEKIEKTLSNVGMTKNEIAVYLALLKLGSSRVGAISKEAGTNRSYSYDALKKLLEKGLVSYAIIGKMKYFRPVSPKRLKSLLKERQDDVDDIMPHLNGLYKTKEKEYNVRLYHGFKGVKTVLLNIVGEGKENCVFGSEAQLYNRFPTFSTHFRKLLDEKNIKIRHIARRGVRVLPSKNTEVRFIPKKSMSPVATNIFGDKIAIIIWSEVPEAVIIHNKAAAESYRSYFNLLWNIARKK